MNRLFFLLILNVYILNAQTVRVIYEVNYQPQKENKERKRELMALDIDAVKNQSLFYNWDRSRRDSLINVNDFKNLEQVPLPYLEFSVFKNYKTTLYCNTLFGTNYCFEKKTKFNWEIMESAAESESKYSDSFQKYNRKFAETSFSGRNWNISFTPDIVLNDGPYFFSGLPGLILTAQSDDGEYVMKAVSITTIQKNMSSGYIQIKPNIKEKKYIEFLKIFKENPALFNINLTNEFNDHFIYQYSGKKDDHFQKTNSFIKKQFQRYNNPIDEDLPVFIVN